MIRFGIIGAGRIAKRFAKSLQYSPDAKLYAISGRNEEKMIAFKEEYPCQTYYLNHDQLIEDKDIDAVYISLPNEFHMEYTLKAIRAGKAVLCEKPSAGYLWELDKMINASKDNSVLFMEAMKVRFTPCYMELKKIISEGDRLGKIKDISIRHGVMVPYSDPARYDVKYGGVLRDLGIYCASWFVDYFGDLFSISSAEAEYYQGSDKYAKVSFSYESGQTGSFEVAYDRNIPSEVYITGEKGVAVIKNMHRPSEIELRTDEGNAVIPVPYDNDDFYGEIKEFISLYNTGANESRIMSHRDSISTLAFIEQIRTSL